jgi:hypothetical protein
MKNNGARMILLKVTLSAVVMKAEYGFDRLHVKVVVWTDPATMNPGPLKIAMER